MSWLSRLFAPKYIGSVVRTIMAFVAGVLSGLPFLAPDDIRKFVESGESLLYAIILAVVTQGWSVFQKAKHSD